MDPLTARSLLEAGRLAEAEAAYNSLLGDPQQRGEAIYGLGVIKFKRMEYGTAENLFTEAISLNPNFPNPLYYLGELAAIRNDRSAAISFYGRVLAMNPHHTGALNRIAVLAVPAGTGALGTTAPSQAGRLPPPTNVPPHHATRGATVQPPQAVTSRPPRAPSSRNSIVGIARHVKRQGVPFNGQMNAKQLLTFRVEVVDAEGRHAGTVGVEMRSFNIKGNIEEGDWVEVAKVRDGGRVKSFMNLTSGVRVSSGLF